MAHRISLMLSSNEEFHEPLYDALEVGNKTFTRMSHTSIIELEDLTNSHSSQSCKNHQAEECLHNLIGDVRLVPVAPKATRTTNDELVTTRLQASSPLKNGEENQIALVEV